MEKNTLKEITDKSIQRMIDDIERYGYKVKFRPSNTTVPFLVKDEQTNDFLTFHNAHELSSFISGLNWGRAAARGKIEELGQ